MNLLSLLNMSSLRKPKIRSPVIELNKISFWSMRRKIFLLSGKRLRLSSSYKAVFKHIDEAYSSALNTKKSWRSKRYILSMFSVLLSELLFFFLKISYF